MIGILAVFVLLVSKALAFGSPIDSANVHVIDGDTIRVHHQKPDVRLVGFNAPETCRAACEAEADLGAKATRRLRELVRTTECRVHVSQERKKHRGAITGDVAGH